MQNTLFATTDADTFIFHFQLGKIVEHGVLQAEQSIFVFTTKPEHNSIRPMAGKMRKEAGISLLKHHPTFLFSDSQLEIFPAK